MTLAQDAEQNRLAAIDQLYDQWHGYYVLRRLIDGQWRDDRALTKVEAQQYRLNPQVEALECHWPRMGRADLIATINAAKSIPAAIRAMAGVFVMRMSDEQIAALNYKIMPLKMALDRGDWDALKQLASENGLPAGYIDYARSIISQKPDQPAGQ